MPESTPEDLGPSGLRLWKSIADPYELEEHEERLLLEAARTADLLDLLQQAINGEGVTLAGKMHPAVAELRMQRAQLSRLIASLRIPNKDGKQPQRRGAARGSYSPGR